MYREYSGGLMAEMGSHFIDIANWAFEGEPVSVIGTGGLDYWKDGREVHDNVQSIFDYSGGGDITSTACFSMVTTRMA